MPPLAYDEGLRVFGYTPCEMHRFLAVGGGIVMPSRNRGHKLIWDEAHWANRAEQARAAAKNIQNPECRRIMSEIAASFDHLAKLSSDFNRAAKTPSPPPKTDP